MESIKYNILIILSLTLLGVIGSNAQIKINFDYKTAAAVTANAAMQGAIEFEHNETLKKIYQKQDSIRDKSIQILSYKQLSLETLKNIKGFETESWYYKDIYDTALKISELTPTVYNAIKNSSFVNKANATAGVFELVSRCSQCVNDFINIVTNGKAKNPLKSTSSKNDIQNKNDGHNYLDRRERMNMACQISYDLKRIKNQLNRILFLCSYGDWTQLISQIDKKTWQNAYAGKTIADGLIKQWKSNIK